MENVRIYDNGGKTLDRYTAVFMDRDCGYKLKETLGFNNYPFQGIGYHTSATPGRHLGKRIKFEDLNADCQKFIINNL